MDGKPVSTFLSYQSRKNKIINAVQKIGGNNLE
jgi:hypothetical protein